MKKILFLLSISVLSACTSTPPQKETKSATVLIPESTVKNIVDSIKILQPSADLNLVEKGVKHAASLWRTEDGTPSDFSKFAKENYISDPAKRKIVFNKISRYFESLSGNYNEITLDLRKTLDEANGDIDEIDRMFGNYSVGSHMQNDFYANKIAFAIALNFPYFTLTEKENLGPKWSRDDWAMARLGDQFISRNPSELPGTQRCILLNIISAWGTFALMRESRSSPITWYFLLIGIFVMS